MEKDKLKKPIILILVALIGLCIVINIDTLWNVLGTIFRIINPFIIGGCLAFILNIPMSFFERKLIARKRKKNKNKNKKINKRLLRVLSIIFAIVVILLIVTFIFTLILPELVNVIGLLIDNIPYYVEQITEFANKYDLNVPDLNSIMEEANLDIEAVKQSLIGSIPSLLSSSISFVGSIISGISSFFIAIIFAIYILIDKEKLQAQVTKLLYAYLKEENVNKIINVGKVTRTTFKNFFTVQCLEATILGVLCIIGMLILRIPYAIPIGILIGVTALIPVVGAFLGAAIGAILILAVNPIKVITFIIFIIILQQVEGNLIYPRVVGNSMGLPGMWVLFAVTVGGSLGGILGMLLGVPITCVIYTLLKQSVNNRIKIKTENI